MKICIITDTHFGVHNDSPIFQKYFKHFYSDIFFPFLEKNNIKTIFHLGDFFDRRKYINYVTLNNIRRNFVNKIKEAEIDFHIILGNHDCYYKNTNEINSVSEIFEDNKHHIKIYNSPQRVNFDGVEISVLPWIPQDQVQSSLDFIREDHKFLFGHLQLTGFEVIKGLRIEEGISPEHFSHIPNVLSGHYHTRQEKGNVNYLGTPYQMSWNDYEDKKGFYVFDTENQQLTFIENTEELYLKFYYNDDTDDIQEKIESFLSKIKEKFVKVVVLKKNNIELFDTFLDKVYLQEPAEVLLIEEDPLINSGEVSVNVLEKDAISLLYECVDDLLISENKDTLKLILKDLYMEAISGEAH